MNFKSVVASLGMLAVSSGLGHGSLSAKSEVAVSKQEAYEWLVAEEILERIQAPAFPDAVYDIREYGAKAGVKNDSSAAFAAAIEACNAAGGGKVLVPEGEFLTGPIHLLSNVNLHLEKGAVVKFSTDFSKYLPAVFTRWEGMECYNYSPLIYAFEQKNIAVTGEGTLDGQATLDNWLDWNVKSAPGGAKQIPARDRLTQMVADGVPVEERVFGEGDFLRPNFLQPYRCENVLIEGVKIINSPMWEIHPVLCRNVIVRGVTVISHGSNNDGCNPESSKDVLIEDCHFDTGDDCIAIKSGRNNDGRRVNVPSENIIIRNCKMVDGHGGVVIGSEISGGVRNVFVENCEMSSPNLDRALRIKTNSIRGGLIENIFVRDVQVGVVKDSVIKVNFLYEEGDAGDFAPVVRNIVVRRLVSRESKYAMFIKGYEHTPITDLHLIDCQFEGVQKPSVLLNVQGLLFDNVRMNTGEKTDLWGNPL
ncbi:glycoside hydrolase family 28 protein [Pelagicoccus sp. SDUM812003]|uniref:glycoside hydrolase family 28 protein n=1 Tax=Pelagicoccus sp. SDUM812003 TaxID=3041267 RepID=UPI00280FEF0E|nr:glycoside hydrolase family 28 protein [Pelagicoccus sp. SDUM812003]MDQ8205371.1 glycoside hydrolase family 28 protein [Pelagicoccus sp. SDUM812003]